MDLKNIFLFIVSIIASYLSLFIVRGKKDGASLSFGVFTQFVSLWTLGVAFFNIVESKDLALLIARLYYFIAAVIPASFLIFSFQYPNDLGVSTRYKFLSLLPFFVISILIIFDNNFILTNLFMNPIKEVSLNKVGYFVYILYFIITLLLAYINLFRSYLINRKDEKTSSKLKLIIIGTIIPYLFGMFFNLILPIYTYKYIWIGPLFALIVCFVVFYAIFKHRLFDVKVVVAEIFSFTLCLFILIRTIVSGDTQEKFINSGLLIFSIVISYFLVKSVRREIETREKIESLATDLETANSHLHELDQQKSEFVSLASHQLRGPLTAIKGYASMLLDNDFGPVDGPVRDAVDKMYQSTQDLVVVVGDYLDVSRIEQGRMKYDFSDFDMKDLVATTITELKPNITRAKLEINFDYDSTGTFMVNADQGKIRQVIGNLLDNSIKYTPKGSIHVWLQKTPENKILLSISDTGVGIRPDVLPRLFEKFTRAPDASKTNILGTGLGLYVAKKMIEAHSGRVWAESPGADKGSTFFVELKAL